MSSKSPFGRYLGFLSACLCLGIALQCVVVSTTPITSASASKPPQHCTETHVQRKAWHTLSDTEKKAYIDAELCLMWQKPARTDHPEAVSLFDDLQGLHQTQALRVHNTGWFLAWHRYMIWAHEKLLKEECGYEGAQPYWDEPFETGNFTSSPLFSNSTTTGFGDIGIGPGEVRWKLDFPFPAGIPLPEGIPPPMEVVGRCIATGPFANYTLRIGPSWDNTAHCISRAVNDYASANSNQKHVDECLALPTFAKAWPCIEASPHGGGHGGVGGEMTNPVSSPGDPLFYLHHTWLDKVWWDWQMLDVPARRLDIAGNTSILPVELADGSGAMGYELANLGNVLTMGGLVQEITLGHAVDLEEGLLACVEYV
ncbi:hypothetical protein DFH27DRAFT_645138 [Peziza echinospora]|nr:hypothetical protein DFH27DRAFT_645138 [Peziza echinospora]